MYPPKLGAVGQWDSLISQ